MSKMQDDKDYKSTPEAPIKANNIVNLINLLTKGQSCFLFHQTLSSDKGVLQVALSGKISFQSSQAESLCQHFSLCILD